MYSGGSGGGGWMGWEGGIPRFSRAVIWVVFLAGHERMAVSRKLELNKDIRLISFNSRSRVSKLHDFEAEILANSFPEIICICETWLKHFPDSLLPYVSKYKFTLNIGLDDVGEEC